MDRTRILGHICTVCQQRIEGNLGPWDKLYVQCHIVLKEFRFSVFSFWHLEVDRKKRLYFSYNQTFSEDLWESAGSVIEHMLVIP